jgi:multidrug efflux pump subunit AcrB
MVDVVARAAAADRASLEALRGLWIPLKDGQSVPLSDVASFEYTLERPVLWRRERVPTITVQADVAPGVRAEAINQQLAPSIARFAAQLPKAYRIATGETLEASEKSMQSVYDVIPAMLVLMLTVLMAQLHSFARLLLVISVAPLGLIGIVAVMLPTQTPMGLSRSSGWSH